ncbi:MAG: molybdopterin cofactor-binding domain-containing protein, partial [Betaproteobacteria bacterium]
MKRRAFLQAGGALAISFTLPLEIHAQPALPPRFQNINAWLKVHADGRVTFHTGKVELGTGITTALSQLIAEELDTSVWAIDLVMGDTELCPDQIG